MNKDFRKSTVYQIYPKSFCDTNKDGLGDLRGVIQKLDYIKELGVDYIWLTPFFVSPQNMMWRTTTTLTPDTGLWKMWKSSSQRVRSAASGSCSIWCSTMCPPAMSGSGKPWREIPTIKTSSSSDLNWENENLRKEIQKILKFWMEKGVRGFRFDVINLISKACYEDDETGDGRKYYTDGPKIHQYLKEMHDATFGTDPGIVTVGEMSSTTMENCFQYAGRDTGELSMVFSFHHLKVDFMGNEKWVLVPADFQKLKNIIFDWQTKMAEHNAWNAVFWCNHDQPRVVSRFGDEEKCWKESAKMLGTIIHCLRGTPYVYQGEEIGMTNTDFTDISQFRDVESLNHYQILQDKGLSASDALRIIQAHSRDNGRTPMQWDGSKYAGFAAEDSAEPWIAVNGNHTKINAADQLKDEDSIFRYYQKLIAMRKEMDVIAYGDIEPLAPKDPCVFAYRRTYEGHELIVAANFYGREYTWKGAPDVDGYDRVIGNYKDAVSAEHGVMHLRPYEAAVWYK